MSTKCPHLLSSLTSPIGSLLLSYWIIPCTGQLFNPFLLAIIVNNVHYTCINTLTLPFSSCNINLYTTLYDSLILGWQTFKNND